MDTLTVREKRRDSRAEVTWPAVILTARGAMVAETRNVSANGAFIFCGATLNPKEKVKVFIMAPNRNSLSVSAEVAWSNPLGTKGDTPPGGAGIRFTSISAGDRRYLHDVIAEQYKEKINRLSETK